MCSLFLSVINFSCRLGILLNLDNLHDLNLHLMCSFFGFLRCNRPGFFSDLFAATSFVSVSLPSTNRLIVILAICLPHVASCERRAPPALLCGSLRLRGSVLPPPTPLLSNAPLRDWLLAVLLSPAVGCIGSTEQRMNLTSNSATELAPWTFNRKIFN